MREEDRNWAELPPDVLSLIFERVGAIDILLSALYVCRPWRQFSFDPRIWKVIDMTTLHGDNMGLDLEKPWIGVKASWRSSGCNTLVLTPSCVKFPAVTRGYLRCGDDFPCWRSWMLPSDPFQKKYAKYIGKACPRLKCYRLNAQGSRLSSYESDKEALAIANHMPELSRIQLVGNVLTNKGLTAILEKCIHLEYLDLRCCFRVDLDANLLAKCARIKDLRLPNDPTDDCGFIAESDLGKILMMMTSTHLDNILILK